MSDSPLEALVYARGAQRPFGELTRADVGDRAEELRAAIGWGPTARVAPVAQAWRELAAVMDAAGAGVVADLPEAQLSTLAPRLWVTSPGLLR